MSRTSAREVRAIAEVADGDDLGPFIDGANQLVTEVCVPLGYDDTRLKTIETWLAAHFYKVFNPVVVQETVSTVTTQFEAKVDLRLQVTRYGQQAMLFDTKGGLAALNNRTGTVRMTAGAGVTWLGRKRT